MTRARQQTGQILGLSQRATTAALVSAILLVLMVFATQSAQAQTFNVLHNFTGEQDGQFPFAGLTMDQAGNLYGTAAKGGAGYGTVFKLKRSGSSFLFNPLYSFGEGNDGAGPTAPVIFGKDGTLYGTTIAGGGSQNGGCANFLGYPGCGTVFNLRPYPTVCKTALCDWNETVLYRFTGGGDGAGPDGALLFDQAGIIYGTAPIGGIDSCFGNGCGVVYKLTPSNGGWVQSVLYSFLGNNGGPDGGVPHSGVVFDRAGNLYGTTYVGGNGNQGGTVFQLTPSGSGWMENQIYVFQRGNDGGNPLAGVIFDSSGSLYGATISYGTGGGGTAFELTPSDGSWALTILHGFVGGNECGGPQYGSLVMDQAGNLYGTTYCDGANNAGSVFKLTPSGGTWMYTSLHDFTGSNDGGHPVGGVTLDSNGNLYGTASVGGKYNGGVIWEITP